MSKLLLSKKTGKSMKRCSVETALYLLCIRSHILPWQWANIHVLQAWSHGFCTVQLFLGIHWLIDSKTPLKIPKSVPGIKWPCLQQKLGSPGYLNHLQIIYIQQCNCCVSHSCVALFYRIATRTIYMVGTDAIYLNIYFWCVIDWICT